mmetsp:Transcript_23113/g.68175  ORF Transcript_23113/g.68175 Transcript_23113/m.68175 type:complete len:260 (-) Transcript_23113:274-1053(-)
MATKRSTLGICEDSVLAKQFNDPLWMREEGKEEQAVVDDWTPDRVESWANAIKGVPSEASSILLRNEISGVHLLAMEREDFQDLGIKAGTLAVLTKAVEELRRSSKPGPTFIEYSPYCFGKIINQLRCAVFRSPNFPQPVPQVENHERKRFKTVVNYYFPGESAAIIIGGPGEIETKILTPSHVDQVRDWHQEDDISGNSSSSNSSLSQDGRSGGGDEDVDGKANVFPKYYNYQSSGRHRLKFSRSTKGRVGRIAKTKK